MPSPNFELYAARNREHSEAYRALVRESLKPGALDAMTKELIYALLLGTQGYLPGMRVHVENLLGKGMAPEAIREAARVVLPALGSARFLALYAEVEAAIEGAVRRS
jgi:alkylhydroperoxidase/carboxymuconolactone decarboxylase family protein YurZ